jgi:mannose-1-phosphate guanylyltransferase
MSAWPPPALVLTAGLGTRLRPLSDYRAKPAMPVGAEALACRILRGLAEAGIEEAVLNLHHLPHTVAREVGDGSQCGLRVRYSWEQPRVLGSAGGPRHALPLVEGDTVLIVNGDTLCDVPLRALWDEHQCTGALVTLGLMPHPRPGRYGGVVLDSALPPARIASGGRLPAADSRLLASGAVTAFVPRTSTVPSAHFPGVQLVQRTVLEDLPDNIPSESVLEVYPRLMVSMPGAVRGAVFEATFDDVGTVDDYRRTCRALAGDVDGNVIDARARIAPGATLRECIAWPQAAVPEGCVLERCVITGHAPLAPGTHLQDAVI